MEYGFKQMGGKDDIILDNECASKGGCQWFSITNSRKTVGTGQWKNPQMVILYFLLDRCSFLIQMEHLFR